MSAEPSQEALSELDIAVLAAREARDELGRVSAELQVARDGWGAVNLAQAEWNDRLDQLLQQLAASAERERQLVERLEAIERSTSWRLLQGILAPYRLARSVSGR